MLAIQAAGAATPIEASTKWGLIGVWSKDCADPGSRKAKRFTFAIVGNQLVQRRNFGDGEDETPISEASVSADGMLNLRINSGTEIRESGIAMRRDGSSHTIYSRNEKEEYSIRDGLIVSTRQPSAILRKCG